MQAAKRATKLTKRLAKGLELADKLGDGGNDKEWKKVAKLLAVDCCKPAKHRCKDCPLAETLGAS